MKDVPKGGIVKRHTLALLTEKSGCGYPLAAMKPPTNPPVIRINASLEVLLEQTVMRRGSQNRGVARQSE